MAAAEVDSAHSNKGCCIKRFPLPTKGCRETGEEFRDAWKDIKGIWHKVNLRRRVRKMCTVDTAKSWLPVTKWLPKYKLKYLYGDFIAGLTIGLTVIPQSLAYASGVANLRPEYGLYTSFMGVLVYAMLGTGRDCAFGPTAVMSLLTGQYGQSFIARDGSVAAALSLVCGCVQLALGFLRIGIVADFISHPVLSAFTTAAGITIAFSQVKNWLGLKNIPSNFVMGVIKVVSKIPLTKWADFGMGLVCMIILHWMKKLKEIKYKQKAPNKKVKALRKTIWVIGIGRNVILVIVTAVMMKILTSYHKNPFTLTPDIPPGLPPFKPPSFSMNVSVNGSYTYYGPSDFFNQMGAGVFVVPILGIVENIAIGKEFGRKNGYKLDQGQEVIALGAANLLGSFVGSYPITASFSRSSLLSQSGVRTQLAGVFTGGCVLLALGVVTPAFKFIPNACLAAVIIMACPELINFSLICDIWRKNKVDLLAWMVTLGVGLGTQIEYGLFAGIGISFLALLYPWSRQKIHVTAMDAGSKDGKDDGNQQPITMLKFSGSIHFPSVDTMRDAVLYHSAKDVPVTGSHTPIIMDFTYVATLDYNAIETLDDLMGDLRKHHSMLVFTHLQPQVLESLVSARLKHFVYYATNEEALKAIRETLQPVIHDKCSLNNFGDHSLSLCKKLDDMECESIQPASSRATSEFDLGLASTAHPSFVSNKTEKTWCPDDVACNLDSDMSDTASENDSKIGNSTTRDSQRSSDESRPSCRRRSTDNGHQNWNTANGAPAAGPTRL